MATFLIFFLVLILYEDSAQKSFQYCTYQKITFVIQTKSLSKAMQVKKETHRDEYKEGPFFQKKYISILLSKIPWRICFFFRSIVFKYHSHIMQQLWLSQLKATFLWGRCFHENWLFLEREKKVQKVLFVANNKEGGGIAKKPSK